MDYANLVPIIGVIMRKLVQPSLKFAVILLSTLLTFVEKTRKIIVLKKVKR